MLMTQKISAVAVAATLLASMAPAGEAPTTSPQREQQHVVESSEIDAALVRSDERDAERREAIRELLRHPRVQDVANALGLEISRADAAVSTLEGEVLAQVASQATVVKGALAGGQAFTITTTTLIIILLVVIILILVV